MSNYNRITFKERVRIEAGIYAKESFSKIAKEIGRSTSSVSREVKENRIMVKSPYACGTDCIYPPSCRKTNLCGKEHCSKKCWTCMEHDCTQYCDRQISHNCSITRKAPFTCDACSEKNKKKCKYNKYYYLANTYLFLIFLAISLAANGISASGIITNQAVGLSITLSKILLILQCKT